MSNGQIMAAAGGWRRGWWRGCGGRECSVVHTMYIDVLTRPGTPSDITPGQQAAGPPVSPQPLDSAVQKRQRVDVDSDESEEEAETETDSELLREILTELRMLRPELRTLQAEWVVHVRSELDAGAAAVVVRLDGDIVAVAFAPQVLKLLRISWPTRRRCRRCQPSREQAVKSNQSNAMFACVHNH
eukprot:COSAG06_NODE_3224_length_5656_cov_2.999460_5_plen_185_part_01